MVPLLRVLGIAVPLQALMNWQPWDTWKETMFFGGVVGLCVAPTLRTWFQRNSGKPRELLRAWLDRARAAARGWIQRRRAQLEAALRFDDWRMW
jgi:hypothetical protein